MSIQQVDTVLHGAGLDFDDIAPDLNSKLTVLNIQRTCVHDGPGLRTTVFFRGCPMSCSWCQNPETQRFVSTSGADGQSIGEMMDVIKKDREYYVNTHGGVTLSGGEPLAQKTSTLVRFLEELKSEKLHVAVETAGDVPWRVFEACLPYVDLFLFDLKVVGDEARHQELTGRKLRRVHENLHHLLDANSNVRFRMCIVPGFNDSRANLEALAAKLIAIGHPSIELMRYYNLHEQKAQRLNLPQAPLHISVERSVEALDHAAFVLRNLGIEVEVTSTEAGGNRAKFTERVQRLKKDIRESGYHVCIESAELKTAYHKKNGFTEPLAVQRADLLRYLLNNKSVIVYPDELLVGNFTSKRVGGSVWVEYFGTAMVINLWNIDRQQPVGFQCSKADKVRFYKDLAPFWAKNGLIARTFPKPTELAMFMARTLEKKAGFNNNLAGIAHYIVNTERLLHLGTRGIANEVKAKIEEKGASEFYDGVLIALTALEEYAVRFANHLHVLAANESDPARKAELLHMAQVCSNVPKNPARTFHEAIQAILFLQIGLCTESFENAISLGRLDQALYPYYKADVKAGRINYERAKELVACLVLKIDELIFLNDGDVAFELGKMFESLSPVETVTVGGFDGEGKDCTNDVSYMVLDVCELRPIGVNMAARIHRDSPPEYVERIAEVYLNGSPMPALYNDEVYVDALRNEYTTTSLKDARNYSIVGCVEPVASDDHFANTDSANVNVVLPFLQALQGDTKPLWRVGSLGQFDQMVIEGMRSRVVRGRVRRKLRVRDRASRVLARLRKLPPSRRFRKNASWRNMALVTYNPPYCMDQLMDRFKERLFEVVRDVLADQQRIEMTLAKYLTTPLASSLYPGCVESGKDVYEGGATINTSGIQAVGVTDVADSLMAIEDVVFKKKLYSIDEVLRAMDADFEGDYNQEIHQHLLDAPKFGNDDSEEAHHWVNRVLQLWVDALRDTDHPSRDGKYVAGYYGLNANMVYGRRTPSLPSGRLIGVPLANSIGPHYGMQMVDLTSALNSVAKVDFGKYAPNGTTVTSTIDTGLFPGESGIKNLAGLIKGYFNQGGMQFQPNLVNRELLLDAYRNPGKHRDLVVRIAGYCAYFDDLSDELKREIIDRSYYTF
ncbi:MAG: radical SAM protein [Proteobacteria bacterium]|nr:radical SAM protein [Pseudomonadota bacterium]